MTELARYSELWDDMDSSLKAWRDEARQLREIADDIDLSDSVQDLHEQLVNFRRAQNRTEAILADAGLVRSRVRKLTDDLLAAYEDKFAENVLNDRTGEYQSAKAQDARYKAGALTELRNLRRAKQMLADVEEVFEFVNIKHRGLDSARRDIDSRIRIISLESQLER